MLLGMAARTEPPHIKRATVVIVVGLRSRVTTRLAGLADEMAGTDSLARFSPDELPQPLSGISVTTVPLLASARSAFWKSLVAAAPLPVLW